MKVLTLRALMVVGLCVSVAQAGLNLATLDAATQTPYAPGTSHTLGAMWRFINAGNRLNISLTPNASQFFCLVKGSTSKEPITTAAYESLGQADFSQYKPLSVGTCNLKAALAFNSSSIVNAVAAPITLQPSTSAHRAARMQDPQFFTVSNGYTIDPLVRFSVNVNGVDYVLFFSNQA